MRNHRIAWVVVLVLGLAASWGPTPALASAAGSSSVAAQVDGGGGGEDAGRAVAYWRVWLTLKPRLRDASVPLPERIDALQAFLSHSPDTPWAALPKAEARALLDRLVGEWRGLDTTPGSPAPRPPAPVGPTSETSVPAAPTEAWDVGRYDPDATDDAALRARVRAELAAAGGSRRHEPRLLFDVLAVGYSAPAGFEAALLRLRWSTLQLQIVAGGGDWTGLLTAAQFWAGVLGVGVRFPFGDERRDEFGVFAFPLSFDIYGSRPSEYGYDAGPGLGFVHTRLYYRHDFDGVALEAAVSAPLVFGVSGVYDGAPPLALSVGLAFGRTR